MTFTIDTLSIPKDLPVNMTDLTEEEMKRAIKALKSNKAAGHDEISAELLKHGRPSTIRALIRLSFVSGAGKKNVSQMTGGKE